MKCALIDLDETLFDHQNSSRMGLAAMCGLFPELCSKTMDELENHFWQVLNDNYKDVLAGKLTVDQARINRIIKLFEFCNVTAPEERLEELSELYKLVYNESIRPVEGMTEVLKCLRENGYRIVVLTNGFVEMQLGKIKACKLEPYINYLVTSEEVGVKKPEEAIYLEAMRRCEASPDETIMVGDAWETDIVGANRLGIRSFWFNRRNELCPDSTMAEVISHPAELLNLLGLV